MSRVEKVLATGKVDRVLKTTRNLRRDELEVAAIT